MVTFADVQKAFQSGNIGNIENYKCLATTNGVACPTELTRDQKEKLRQLLQVHKDALRLNDIRTVIWDLLCGHHQEKQRRYEEQIEAQWKEEFPLDFFRPKRSKSRRTNLSRSQTPASGSSSKKATLFSSQRSRLSKSASEPQIRSVHFSQAVDQSLVADEVDRPSTPTLASMSSSSPIVPGIEEVAESIEDESPSRGRASRRHWGSASTLSVQEIPNSTLPSEGPELDTHTTVDHAVLTNDSAPFPSHPEGIPVPKATVSRFGPSEQDVKPPSFQPERLDLGDHRWGDSSKDISGEFSKSRVMRIFHKTDETGDKVEKVIAKDDLGIKDPEGPPCPDPKTPETGNHGTNQNAAAVPSGDQHRPSLSPEVGRRRSSYEKSPDRYRSPSTPLLTERGKLAFTTMQGDASYDRPAKDNERNVVELLNKPLSYSDEKSYGKVGWVYAIRDPELDLVKIGCTRQGSREIRLGNLRNSCKLGMDARIVPDLGQVPLVAFKRLEELVHMDLQPHRWYYDCECGLKSGRRLYPREHHEWYDVSDDIAVQTVNVWRDFLLLNPYGVIEAGKSHSLRADWVKRINNREDVAEDETHHHHERRLSRWKAIFPVKLDATPESTSPLVSTGEVGDQVVEVKIKDEKQPTVLMESIVPFEGDRRLLEGPISLPSKPDIQLDGIHLATLSTPSTSGDNDIKDGKAEATNLGMNESSSDAPSQDTSKIREVHAPTQLETSAHISNPVVETTGGNPQPTDGIVWNPQITTLQIALNDWLRKERHGLPSRSIHSDLIRFRWPLTSVLLCALYTPYAPPILSAFVWCVFLPFFVGELREWS